MRYARWSSFTATARAARCRSPSSARRGEIPVQFLEQLFATLRRAGIVALTAGREGRLHASRARPMRSRCIELVELLDGPLGRGAQGIFVEAAQAAGAVLAEATVASVAEQELQAAGAPMYHI